LLKSAALEQI